KARATTATNSKPTNRIMMVPIPGGEGRNGIGSVLSGRMLFMKVCPRKGLPPRDDACSWSQPGPGKFNGVTKRNRRAPVEGGRRESNTRNLGISGFRIWAFGPY